MVLLQRVSRRVISTTACRASSKNLYPFPEASKPTPHQIFHLPKTASQDDVKARYYDLVRIYHPDKVHNVSSEVAHTRFQAITAAYNALQGGEHAQAMGASGPSTSGGYGPDAASWRAMHIYRRRKLYEGSGDDLWKDRIIIAGVLGTVGVILVQTFMTRQQAIRELRDKKKQFSAKKIQEEYEDARLAAHSTKTS